VKLEFPAPPLRSSMTAEEATEFGRTRARSRSDSLLERNESSPKDDVPRENLPVEREKILASASSDSHKDASSAPPAASTSSPKGIQQSVFKDLLEDSNAPRQSSLHSPEPRDVSRERESVLASSSESTGESNSAGSRKQVANGACERDGGETIDPTNSRSTPSSSGGSSSSDDDSSTSSSDGSSSSSSSPENSTDKKKAAIKPSLSIENKADYRKSMASSRGSRIGLDRGPGHGRVEVVVGARTKQRTWKPVATVADSHGEEYGLLGNRRVEQWADDDDEDNDGRNDKNFNRRHAGNPGRSKLIDHVAKTERTKKRKMYVDRWDATLDQGKVRKMPDGDTRTQIHLSGVAHFSLCSLFSLS